MTARRNREIAAPTPMARLLREPLKYGLRAGAAALWFACLGSAIVDPSDRVEGRTAHASMESPLSLLGHVGGAIRAVDVWGDVAYVGAGPRVVLIDIKDPHAPRLLAEMPPLSDIVRDIKVAADRVYVAAGNAGVAVISTSQPSRPEFLDLLDTPGYAWSVSVSDVADDRVFVADGPAGLGVLRLADGRLQETAALAAPADQESVRVVVGDGIAYVLNSRQLSQAAWIAQRASVSVYDIGTPDSPVLLTASLPALVRSTALALDGHVLYAALEQIPGSRDFGLYAFNVSQPTEPILLSSTSLSYEEFALDIAVRGNRLAMSGGWSHPLKGWLQLFDVADPSHPTSGDVSYVSPDGITGVAVSGPAVVSVSYTGELRLYAFSTVTEPPRLGSMTVGFVSGGAIMSGSTLYIGTYNSGIAVVDLSGSSALRLTGTVTGTQTAPVTYYHDLVRDPPGGSAITRFVAVASELDVAEGSLRVFDSSSPVSPGEIGLSLIEGTLFGPAVYTQGRVFVLDFSSRLLGIREKEGVHIFDLTRPALPAHLATYALEGPTDITSWDRYVYISSSAVGLIVLDTSRPDTHWSVGQNGQSQNLSLCANGGSLYTVSDDMLQVYTLRDPRRPQLASETKVHSDIVDVACDDGWVYVGYNEGDGLSDASGICPVDVTLPDAPRRHSCRELPGGLAAVSAADGLVTASAYRAGLFVFRALQSPLWELSLPGLNLSRSTGESSQ